MSKNKTENKNTCDDLVEAAKEIRVKLREIDQKVEYLIRMFRDWSHRFGSSFDEFIS